MTTLLLIIAPFLVLYYLFSFTILAGMKSQIVDGSPSYEEKIKEYKKTRAIAMVPFGAIVYGIFWMIADVGKAIVYVLKG